MPVREVAPSEVARGAEAQLAAYSDRIPQDTEKGFPLLRLAKGHRTVDDLVISDRVTQGLLDVVAENKASGELAACGLRPKNRILFCGRPGTGKTMAAGILGSAMGLPVAHVMFDSIVSSYLGDTATNLRKIFEFVRGGEFVTLFDEFDIVGKRRDDPHEHGEIKRVVNNFMQMMDEFSGPGIIVAATNHPHLLDTAVWRRFDDIMLFDMPDAAARRRLFEKYAGPMRRSGGASPASLSRQTRGYSAADVARVCQDAIRRSVIRGDRGAVTDDYIKWAILQQKRRRKAMAAGV